MSTSRYRDFDAAMFTIAMVLMSFGIIAIWSARGGGSLSLYNEGVRQAVFGALGVCLLLIVANFDYRFLGTLAWIGYFVSIGALALVLAPGIGVEIAGSRRWFEFGPITLQPSEFAKLATILALATFISTRAEEMQQLGNFVLSLLIALVPAGLVFLEPDLGSASVFGVIWFSMILVANIKWRYLGGLLLLSLPFLLIAWEFLLQPYQRNRLLISLDPYDDPTGSGYNIIQARYAIGSGGMFGDGIQGGTQSRLELLKVRESDFIFAHASGMVGFVGMTALIVCFGILIWRCIRATELAKDTFGQMIAYSLAAVLFYQAFVNIGMNIGIMPVTGITLPLVSQGSSSLWTFLLGLGILQSINLHHRKLGFQTAY